MLSKEEKKLKTSNPNNTTSIQFKKNFHNTKKTINNANMSIDIGHQKEAEKTNKYRNYKNFNKNNIPKNNSTDKRNPKINKNAKNDTTNNRALSKRKKGESKQSHVTNYNKNVNTTYTSNKSTNFGKESKQKNTTISNKTRQSMTNNITNKNKANNSNKVRTKNETNNFNDSSKTNNKVNIFNKNQKSSNPNTIKKKAKVDITKKEGHKKKEELKKLNNSILNEKEEIKKINDITTVTNLNTKENKTYKERVDTFNSNISTNSKITEDNICHALKRSESYEAFNLKNQFNIMTNPKYELNNYIKEIAINNLKNTQDKKRLSNITYKQKIKQILEFKKRLNRKRSFCLCPFHLKKGFFTDIQLDIPSIIEEKNKFIVFDEEKLKEAKEKNLEIEKNNEKYLFKNEKAKKSQEISFELIAKNKKQEFIIDSLSESQISLGSDSSLTKETSIQTETEDDSSLTEEKGTQTDIEKTSLSEKPKGLKNFALNCYMNSLLQCFYHIKGIRESFLNPKQFSCEEQKVCYSLSEVMEGLTNGNKKNFSVNTFKETLGEINSLFSGSRGADVSDLYRTVVDSIIDEIPYEYNEDEDYENQKQNYEEAKKEVDPNNPINKELNYFYETIYICPKGNKIYSVQNDSSIMFELLKISKCTKGKLDIYKCMDYNFRVIQNNEFYCSKCNCTHKNKSQDRLLSLPKILTIILNRGKGKQYVDNVDFDKIINIKKYVDDTFIDSDKKKFNYKLIGVSTHIGSSSSSGHYIAYCYRENEKQYYCFNDTSAEPVKFKEIKSYGEPYMLFYEQTDETN